MSYQVIKLSNGEDIVCQVHQSKSSAETNKLKIQLKQKRWNKYEHKSS